MPPSICLDPVWKVSTWSSEVVVLNTLLMLRAMARLVWVNSPPSGTQLSSPVVEVDT